MGSQPERDVGEPMLLTYKEAARKIGISLSTLYKLLRAGEIRKLEVGPNTMRITTTECREYVDRLVARQSGPKAGEAA